MKTKLITIVMFILFSVVATSIGLHYESQTNIVNCFASMMAGSGLIIGSISVALGMLAVGHRDEKLQKYSLDVTITSTVTIIIFIIIMMYRGL